MCSQIQQIITSLIIVELDPFLFLSPQLSFKQLLSLMIFRELAAPPVILTLFRATTLKVKFYRERAAGLYTYFF